MTTVNNHQQSFKGWVRVDKTNLANLGKNIKDSASTGLKTTGLSASVVAEATAFPADIASNKGFAGAIKNNKNFIFQKIKSIFGRKINPIKITDQNPERTKELANAASGSGVVSTGMGSYVSAGASAMDQSVHYPGPGSNCLPNDIIESFKENSLQKSAYDLLYNERGFGNESASSISTASSGAGALTQACGSNIINQSFSKKVKDISKNIPS